jgi:DNA sulfur modification protein DndD
MCYYGGDNTFDFINGLNLILGANGYGKSKLYDGFQWVFSDQVTSSDPNNKSGYKKTTTLKKELISEKALIECATGEQVECKVELEVEHYNGTIYKIIRSYTCKRLNDEEWFEPNESKLAIYKKDYLDYKPVPENDKGNLLDLLLPTDVRPYMWFQGERGINALIDVSSENSLKNVIRKLSDISKWDVYIDTSKKAWETAKNAFDQAMKNSKRNQDRIATLQSKQNQLEREIGNYDKLIEENQRNLKLAQEKNEEMSIQLENASSLQKLQAEEESILKDLRRVVAEIDAANESFNRKLFNNYWLLSGLNGVTEKYDKLFGDYNATIADKKNEENLKRRAEEQLQTRLPDGVPEPIHIRKMLEIHKCLVCDRDAPVGSPAYEAIKSLLVDNEAPKTEAVKSELYPLFNDLYRNNIALEDAINHGEEQIRDEILAISKNSTLKQQLVEDLEIKGKEIQEQLRISGLNNPKHIIDSFRITSADISKYAGFIAKDESSREDCTKELKLVTAELGRLSEGEIPASYVIKRDLLADFKDLTVRVKKAKYLELVGILEAKANEHYEAINRPTGAFYGKIKFEEIAEGGYRPIIVDPAKEDLDVTGSLNTSVISAMKLAIIMAIVSANTNRNYVNFYPLISDAPASDFDVVKTKTFLLETAQTFKQSIIIMKETLVEDDAREMRYKPDMEKIYEIKHALTDLNVPMKVYQIDMPDGVSNKHRNEISIDIKPIIN